ncbi:MBG domain-containing protein [Oleiharenicola lentus]|uniref:MBG domain-containing protein n=1 Tax=Oleiharenicola lentus TaxID=2508720 RepID=UPI003F674E39
MKTPRRFARPLLLVEFFRRCITPVSLPLVAAMIAPLAVLPSGYALPRGAQVVAGSVDISQAGNTLNIAQGSQAAIVNWQGFNIGANELVRVLQSGADAAMLARVTGGDPSQLLGKLQADGKLFLINPNGVVVGSGAVIDTAAFLASTLDVADADFLKSGALTFKGDSANGVVNLGKIIAREGNVILIAHTVKNAGEISAGKGTAGLAAGTEVYLASPDAANFVVKTNLTTAAANTGVENSGVIAAAQAELKAAGGSIYDLAVNQSGVIRASGFENRNGRIVLTAEGGSVSVSGTASARNADGSGGEILVGGDFRGANASVANAANTYVGTEARLDASAAAAGAAAGRVIVWADNHTAFLGHASASGAGGGFAEISGKRTLDFRPADVIELGRNGTLLLDPDALHVANVDPGTAASFMSITTLQNQLAASNVTLDTSTSAGDVTFASDVTWATASTLRVNSGNNINVNASLTGGAGSVVSLYAGKAGMDVTQGPNSTTGNINQAAGSTITAGTLTVGVNSAANVPNNNGMFRGSFELSGVLKVGTLQADLSGRFINLLATNAANAIGTLKTTGSGGHVGEIDIVDGAGDLDVQMALTQAETFQVRAITPGTLTLKSGSAMSFASGADVIFVSTGGNFVNEAGANAVGLNGSNGRFLIYSGTSGATVTGGLFGIEEFSRTYTGNPPGDYSGDTLSRFLYRASGASLPQLTYRANNASRNYGYADPTWAFTVSGEQPGLAVATNVTGAPTLSTTATATSSVGSYTINIAQGTLASSAYDFNFVNGSFTINTAPVTFAVNAATRLYGDANPTFSLTATGLRNGESLSAAGNFDFSTSATNLSNVGNYAVSAAYTGGGTGNYSIGAITAGSLAITMAPLTVTAPTFTRIYGQDTTVALNDVVYTGLKTGADALTSLNVTTAATGTGVGTYAVTPTGTSNNYEVTFVPGALTITPAALTIRANDITRTYGDVNPTLTVSNTGLVNSDTAVSAYTGLTISTSATQASNVGTYSIVPANATGANYAISFTNGTFTIDRATLNATVADATRTYTQSNPAFSFASVTGFKNGETASVLSGLNFSTTATNGSIPGRYTINATATAQNYSLNFTPGSLTVTKAPATFSFGTFNRVYGDAPFAFTPALTGFLAGDTAQITGVWSAGLTDSRTLGAGTYAVNAAVVNASLANFYSQFYDITFNPGSLTVARAPLTLVARSGNAQYGTGLSTNGYDVLGLRNSDTAAVLTGTQLNNFSLLTTTDVGAYPVTFASAGTAANYTISTVNGELRVDRRQLHIAGPIVSTYEGVVPPALDPTQPTLVAGGPQFRIVGSVPSGAQHLPAGTDVPVTLRIVPAAGTSLSDITSRYAITSEPGLLTIKALPESASPHVLYDPTIGDPVMISPLILTLSEEFTLDSSLLETKEKTIFRVSTLEYNTPLGPTDFADIITGNTARLQGVMTAFRESTAYTNDYSAEQRQIVEDFISGKLTPADLAARMKSDPNVQMMLMPIFGSYAMDLVTNGAASNAEKRLVHFMSDAAAEQRVAIADKARQAYSEWEVLDASKSSSGLYALYNEHLVPDVVSGAQQEALGAILGGVAGGVVAGGAVSGALLMSGSLVTALFPYSTSLMAVSAIGPGIAIGAVVAITVIMVNAIETSDKNRAAYEEVLARANEARPYGMDRGFELTVPQSDRDRAEVMTSFLQVFGTAFGG